jgi:hypothetical protein
MRLRRAPGRSPRAGFAITRYELQFTRHLDRLRPSHGESNVPTSGEEVGEGRYPASSCAGPQLDFPDQQFQGVAEVWVPFEEAIVIGWR